MSPLVLRAVVVTNFQTLNMYNKGLSQKNLGGCIGQNICLN